VRSGKAIGAPASLQTKNINGAAIEKRQTIDTCGSTTPSWNFSASQVVLQMSTVPAKRPKSPAARGVRAAGAERVVEAMGYAKKAAPYAPPRATLPDNPSDARNQRS
jgi:hypothetical protein